MTKRTPNDHLISQLIDLVNGHLDPDEALRLMEQVGKDQQLSKDLDLVLALKGLSREDWLRKMERKS